MKKLLLLLTAFCAIHVNAQTCEYADLDIDNGTSETMYVTVLSLHCDCSTVSNITYIIPAGKRTKVVGSPDRSVRFAMVSVTDVPPAFTTNSIEVYSGLLAASPCPGGCPGIPNGPFAYGPLDTGSYSVDWSSITDLVTSLILIS